MSGLRWQPIATAPKDGTGILVYGRHVEDSPPGASRGVRAGDHWFGIVVRDVWSGRDRWAFAKDGTTTWSEPTHWVELQPPSIEGEQPAGAPDHECA